MSASEHINPALFHGTAHIFSENERLRLGTTKSNAHYMLFQDETPRVYLSSDLEESKDYAARRARNEGKLFGAVYEIDAPDAISMSKDFDDRGFKPLDIYETTYSSKSENIVPKKLVAWAINPDINEKVE